MTSGADWQARVGQSWAEAWPLTDRSFTDLTARLLARIAPLPGQVVHDIGCGAGELALALAAARPAAAITGIDISPDLIAAARRRAGAAATVRFVLGDAAGDDDFGPPADLLVSRHGVMFFADPVAAFARLARRAAPGAGLVFSCFRAPAENGWASGLARLLDLPPPADPAAPGPFAFADSARVAAILTAAGWGEIAFEPVDFAYIAGEGADPVADALAFFARIGPAASALAAMAPAARAAAEQRMADWLGQHRDGRRVVLPAAAWIVTARNC